MNIDDCMKREWVLRHKTLVAAYTPESETDVAAFTLMQLNMPVTGHVTVTRVATGKAAFAEACRHLEAYWERTGSANEKA